jgi:hypothetical protein
MKSARVGLALLALAGWASVADAHGVLIPPGGFPVGGFGLNFSRHTRHTHFSFGLSRGGYYYPPYPCYPAYYPPVPNSLNFVQVYTPPPVAPPPILIAPGGFREPDVEPPPPRRPRPRVDEFEPPLPGEPAGGFRPIRPEERERARQPEPPVPPMPPAPPKARAPEPRQPEWPRPLRPAADPQAENARLVALGREAFAAGEYGRAAERFRQATEAAPHEPLAHFLLAQAQVALGKYDEAVEAVRTGLRLKPDWPAADFRPVELYNGHIADLPQHLAALEGALARHPDDPVLLFLTAYQLWFDGRQDEARPLFGRAAAVLPDPADCERFLLARPGTPPV